MTHRLIAHVCIYPSDIVRQRAGLAPSFGVATKVIEILTVVARGEIQILIHWIREKKNS